MYAITQNGERCHQISLPQHTHDAHLDGVSSSLLIESMHVSLTESLDIQRLVHTTIKVIIYTNEKSITNNNILKLKVINFEKKTQFQLKKEKPLEKEACSKTKQLPK